MFFQVALGALYIHIILGRKLRADLIIGNGTCLKVLAALVVKSSFGSSQTKQVIAIPPAYSQTQGCQSTCAFLSLLFEELPLGAEPVLFFLAGFAATTFV